MFKKSARGLFDLLMATMAVSTLLTTTPTGELLLRGGRWALTRAGLRVAHHHTELIAFFGDPTKPIPAAFTAPEPTGLLANIARAYGAEPAVLKGFALASASDPSTPELSLDDLTSAGKELLRTRGANEGDLATGVGRLRAVSQAIADLTRDLGSPDAALCALVVGLPPVQYAVERVKAERGPLILESLTPHLSPGERTRTIRVVGQALMLATAYDLSWPVPRDTRIGSRFGRRVDPISGAEALHNGVDLSVASGTPIASAGEGQVRRAGEDGVNGKFLIIDHGRGVTTGYCHNSELLVARGARVTRGANITYSGNTGRSTGPHLHYTLAIDGVAYDPLLFRSDSERAVLTSAIVPTPAPSAPAVRTGPPATPTEPATVAPSPRLLGAFAAAAAGPDAGAIPEPAPPPPPAPPAPAPAEVPRADLPPDAAMQFGISP